MTFNPFIHLFDGRFHDILFKSLRSIYLFQKINRICNDNIRDNVLKIIPRRGDNSIEGKMGQVNVSINSRNVWFRWIIVAEIRGINACFLPFVASESWAFQFLLAERRFQRERWTEQERERERTVDRQTERRKCEGIRAWLERAGESRAFPSKLWNLFLEETQRTRGKPGGYLSKRLRNNCSAIRMPPTKPFPFHPIRFPFFIFLRFYSKELFHWIYTGCAIINFLPPNVPYFLHSRNVLFFSNLSSRILLSSKFFYSSFDPINSNNINGFIFSLP